MKPRKQVEFSERFNKRWLGYAVAAAGAAGVGMLGSAQSALADIIYTPAHTLVPVGGGPVSLDLNHDGVADFSLWNIVRGPHSGIFSAARMYLGVPPAGNGVLFSPLGTYIPSYGAARLAAGAGIGPGGHFVNSQTRYGRVSALLMGFRTSSGPGFGPWRVGGAGYLGLQFQIDGQTHYGWASLTTKVSLRNEYQELLTGYVYDTVANQSLTAGQGQTPEPGTLGLLALGSLGLGFWRRRKVVGGRP
jgi:PEP-CTERM motif